jgi:hypothetical protein
MPWAITDWKKCPDSQQLWERLKGTGSTPGVELKIKANLNGMVSVARRSSPGAIIIDVNYPYTVDLANVCAMDHQTSRGRWHGQASFIDAMARIHKAVGDESVIHIDLTSRSAFGASPVSKNLLQLTRMYGYPHPSPAGQELIGTSAAARIIKLEQ